jgi:hypothetical protein
VCAEFFRSGLDEAKESINRRRMQGVQKLVSSLVSFQRSAKVGRRHNF